MSVIAELMRGLTGTGRRRAVDRIPELTAERDRWRALAEARQEQLAHADRLISKVCREKAALRVDLARAEAECDNLAVANEALEQESDELAARLNEARSEVANLLAIRSPAPADSGPAIPLTRFDAAKGGTFNALSLWDSPLAAASTAA
jgi:seryl-tRNA synthetase